MQVHRWKTGLPRPALSASMAPPGAPPSPAGGDWVTLGADPNQPEQPSGHDWKRWGLVGLGAVALAGAGLMVLDADRPPELTPTASQVEPESASRPTTSNAPVTLLMEEPDLDARAKLVSVATGKAPASRPFASGDWALEESRGVETAENGSRLEWSHTSLKDTLSDNLFTVTDLTGIHERFLEEAERDWSYHATMQPAGSTGRLASVATREGGYTGGMGEHHEAGLRTFDRETGGTVRLEDLLAPHDLEDLVGTIRAELAKPANEGYRHDEASLTEHINNSFAVYQQEGRTRITVAIPHAFEYGGGSVAQFTFQLGAGVTLP